MRKNLVLILTIMVAVALATPLVALGTPDYEESAFFLRLEGSNRYETSVAVSQLSFAADDYEESADDDVVDPGLVQRPDVVVVATGANWPDALAAGPFAADFGEGNASILLTQEDTLPGETLDEIDRLDPQDADDQVVIVGGPGAVSSAVERDLEDEDYSVQRFWGDDRFGTAADLDDEMGRPDNVYVCTGENFPDCLAASAAGAAATFDNLDIGDAGGDNTASILLVKKDEIPAGTADALGDADRDLITIVGGTGVVSDTVEDDLEDYLSTDGDISRIAGADRYETAVELAEGNTDDGGWDLDVGGGAPVTNMVFARGDDAGGGADALTGSLLAARDEIAQDSVVDEEEVLAEGKTAVDDAWQLPTDDGPIVLVRPDGVPGIVDGFVGDCGNYEDGMTDHCFGYVLGGTGAISDSTANTLGDLLSGEEWVGDSGRLTETGWCFEGDTDCAGTGGSDDGDGEVDDDEAINLYVCVQSMGDNDEQYWPWAWDMEADLTDAGGADDVEFDEYIAPEDLEDCDPQAGAAAGGDGEGFIWNIPTNTLGEPAGIGVGQEDEAPDAEAGPSEEIDVDIDAWLYDDQMTDDIDDIPFD